MTRPPWLCCSLLALSLGCRPDCPKGSTYSDATGLCHLLPAQESDGPLAGEDAVDDDPTELEDSGGEGEDGDSGGEDGGGDSGGEADGGSGDVDSTGSVDFLGGGTHRADAVEITSIATAAHGLVEPRDLAFDPEEPTHLWVVDRDDNAMIILTDPGQSDMSWWRSTGLNREHWLARPSALVFGAPGYLATAHDSDGDPPEGGDPSFAMGPTLWPSALLDFDGGMPSHLDMVHDPALMQGIAWERDHVYWIHDGWNRCLTRMDFAEPHEPGGTWHGDADVDRFICGQVSYTDDLPAHMEWDASSSLLWFVDPTFATVSTLDPSTATEGASVEGADEATRNEWTGATVVTVASGEPFRQPSGLALHEDMVLISDPATSRVVAIDHSGAVIDWLDTGLPVGSLGGLEVGPDGALWVVDKLGPQVLRIAPR